MIDWDMQLALEEVDALTPNVPPIAPPRPRLSRQLRCEVGAFVGGAYIVKVDERAGVALLSNDRWVTREWVEDNVTSGARA